MPEQVLIESGETYPQYQWANEASLSPREFRCGYCDTNVGPDRGYYATDPAGGPQVQVYHCSRCRQPTYFDTSGRQVPGVPHGDAVEDGFVAPSELSLVMELDRLAVEKRRRQLKCHPEVADGCKRNRTTAAHVGFEVVFAPAHA